MIERKYRSGCTFSTAHKGSNLPFVPFAGTAWVAPFLDISSASPELTFAPQFGVDPEQTQRCQFAIHEKLTAMLAARRRNTLDDHNQSYFISREKNRPWLNT